MRRLTSLFMPVLLICTALLGAVGANPAVAATTATAVDFACVAHAPIVGDQNVDQQLTFSTDAPDTIEAGSTFNVVVTPGAIVVPSSMSGVTVNSITNVKMRIPVSPNAQYISGTTSGGSNFGGAATVNLVSGVIEVSMPGPLNGGATVQPPTVTTTMKATGPVGSTIDAYISGASSPKGYTMTVNTSVGQVPTECQPKSPNPALASGTIVDTTAPSVTFSAPVNGSGYALDAAVNASYSCDDGTGSGVASCVGTVANGSPIDTSTLGAHSFSVTTTDNSGNTNTQTISYNVVVPSGDTTPPTVTVTSPTNGTVYTQGQAVAANYSCSDNIALGSCTGTVANGANIDTSTTGPKTFTVNATDGAGNTASKTVGYYVTAGGATVTGPKNVGTLTASGSNNIDGANVFVKVTAPAPNGGTIPVGTVLTVDYQVYKPHGGIGSNGGPDPNNWTLNAPSNSVITGNVVVNENGINGETHGDAYGISGNTGLKSLSPANPQNNSTSVTVSYDGRSYQGIFDCCNNDGVLIHVQFQALVTTPGLVTIKGFDGLSGTDPTFPSGPFSTNGITDAQVGISYTAVDVTPPTITINSPTDGSLYNVGQVVNADYSCADNVGVATCTGDLANGQPVPTAISGPHSFQVTSTDAAGNTAQSTVSYRVADPTVGISGCTADEGTACKFTVTLSNASNRSVAVNYATADGTAVDGYAYTGTSGVLTFAPGETSKQISVATLGHGIQEPDSSFTMTLSNPDGATMGTDTATGTVHDTSLAPYAVGLIAEIHRSVLSGPVTLSIPVVLQNNFGQAQASAYTITADYNTVDWSAHAGIDYPATTGTLTFQPGETVKYVDIVVPNNNLAQLDRVVFLQVHNLVNARAGGISGVFDGDPYTLGFGVIKNDNIWPKVGVVAPAATSIPAGGSAWVTFTVSQSGSLSDDIRAVTFSTADGTAVAGTDYDARTGSILWAANSSTARTVSVRVHPTGPAGTTKTVKLVLSNPGGPMTLDAAKTVATATINIT